LFLPSLPDLQLMDNLTNDKTNRPLFERKKPKSQDQDTGGNPLDIIN